MGADVNRKPYYRTVDSIQHPGTFKVVIFTGQRKIPGQYLKDENGQPRLFATYGQAERAGEAACHR